ncbi:MAG: hypothetical protein JXA49_05050 [Actinobacteria bacterium]|nr:hypothetical protein [Actinomycetota bacterium]
MVGITGAVKKNKKLISASLLFFIFCSAVTMVLAWQMWVHMDSYYFSPEPPGDGMGTIATNWYNEYARENDLPEPVTDFFAYPFGYDRRGQPVYPLATGLMNQLTRVIGPQAAFNILILMSFPAGALLMFLLIYFLTGSYSGAVVGGFLYGFSPWHVARTFNHVTLSAVHTLPLFALAIIIFWKRKDAPSALLTAGAFIIAAYTDLHLALFCVFLSIMWWASGLFNKRGIMSENGENIRAKAVDNQKVRFALLVMFVVIFSVAAVAPYTKNIFYRDPAVFTEQETRGIEATVDFASDPWNYVVPPAYSSFWSGLTDDFISPRLEKRTISEVTAYPGIITIALALACLYLVRKKNALSDKYGLEVQYIGTPGMIGDHGKTLNRAVNFSVLSIVIAFILSMPPLMTIGNTRVPTPSIVISAIVPFFRYYSRWSLVVTFGLCLLAGIGFALLKRKWRLGKRTTAAACLAAIMLFTVDTTIVPPFRSKEIRVAPEVITKLAGFPKYEPVAIYPLAQGQEYATLYYFYLQQFHLHPMLNGIKPATEADLYRLALKDIYSPYTPKMLKALNISKAIVLNDYYADKNYGNYPVGAPFDPGKMPEGYTLAAKTDDGCIYEITAEPAPVFPLYNTNFTPPAILEDGRSWSVMTGPTGQILLKRVSDHTKYSFSIEVYNPGEAGTVRVKVDDRTIEAVNLETGKSLLYVPELELYDESETIEFEWDGSPVQLDGKQFRTGEEIDAFLLFSNPQLSELDPAVQ